jgi:hypothetical protein
MPPAETKSVKSLADLLGEYWGRTPTSFRADLFTQADSWDIIQRSCWDFRHGDASDNIKLYADGRQIVSDLYRRLPDQSDRDFTAYAERVLDQNQAKSFLFYSAGCQSTAGPDMCKRVRGWIEPLFDAVGYPDGRVEIEVFGGIYTDTPGGIHREACHNLQAVTLGRKEMNVWDPAKWSPDDGSGEPIQKEREIYNADFLDSRSKEQAGDGTVLRAVAGESFYWPPYYWHVGASPSLSLANVVAVYMSTTIGDVLDAIAAHLAAMNPRLDREGGTIDEVGQLLTEFVTNDHIPLIVERMRAKKRQNAGLHLGYR